MGRRQHLERSAKPIAAALLALALWPGLGRADTPAPVRTESGLVQGVLTGDVVAYKGLPYAAAPVGPLRWRPPEAPGPWTGVRQAGAFGPICPQKPARDRPENAGQSEDCLALNIWAPAHVASPAPVMVWIHGGGDDSGAAAQAQYDGAIFARDGVVFVSIDYRLGLIGWLAHPALTREAAAGAPLANYGLMDQIAALKWVRRNIRAFGGDPGRVTVAGESAGGEGVLLLMSAPSARGLFAQAIVESGSGWGDYPSLAEAEKSGVQSAIRAGAPADADAAALRALSAQALVGANMGVGAALDGRLLKAGPARVFEAGAEAPVPLLIGSNSGEDSLIGRGDPKWVLKDYTPDQLAALRKAYGAEAPDDNTLARLIFRDRWEGAPAHWLAGRHAARAPTFLYHFDYVPEILRGRRKTAGHGYELLFVFESMDRAPIPLPASAADTAEMALVHSCWAAFVKTGVPSCSGGPAWPAYSPASDQLMLFGPTAASVEPRFGQGPYGVLEAIEDQRLKAPASH